MAELENDASKQKKKTGNKSKIDWAELGMNCAVHATSAIISGFCLAAGGYAFSEVAKPRQRSDEAHGDVVNIHRKQG